MGMMDAICNCCSEVTNGRLPRLEEDSCCETLVLHHDVYYVLSCVVT